MKSRNINNMWTQEEEKFLYENYNDKSWDYILKNLPRHNKKNIIDKASYMNFKRARLFTMDDINILKEIYPTYSSVDDVVKFFNGKYTKKQIMKKASSLGIKNRKTLTKTLKNIDDYIRSNNEKWKIKIRKQCNYSCIFSGNKNIDIHHIYPFHKILQEVFIELGYDYNKEYFLNEKQIKEICDNFFEKQDKLNCGVCIDKDIHKLFHSIYSYTNFTQNDWDKFKIDLLNGKYNDYLKKGILKFY